MDIGIIKENDSGRVLISPATAKILINSGHNVYLSSGAGLRSGFSDDKFKSSGCHILKSNEDVIDKSNLLTSFLIPEKSLIARMSNKVLFARANTISNIEKIKILSKNKNTLIDIEMLKNDKNQFVVRDKLSQIESIIAYNIVNYKYNFLNPLTGGKLINNLNFNKRKSISIVGWNKNGEEIYNLYKGLNCNIYVYDNFENIGNNVFPDDAWIIPLSEINNVKRSDIVFITSRDFYRALDINIGDNIINDMKKDSVVFIFFSDHVKIPIDNRDSCFGFVNINDSYWGFFSDISRYNASDISVVLSFYILSFIEKIANAPTLLTKKGSSYMRSIVILKGRINNNYKFNVNIKNSHNENIKNPFDLMDMKISSGLDGLNDRLNDLSDFDI